MSFFGAFRLVLAKDVRVELRTREVLISAGLFAVLVALIASLAFYLEPRTSRELAPGVIWTAIAFAGLLAMTRSFGREREGDAFRMLLLAPIPRPAIYLGKAAASFLFLALVELVVVPFVGVAFHVDLVPLLGPLVLLLGLGTLGFVLTGTLFSALALRSASRELLTSLLVFPLVTPALLSAVVATRELFGGAPFAELLDWVRLLAAYDLTALTLGAWLFGPLVSE